MKSVEMDKQMTVFSSRPYDEQFFQPYLDKYQDILGMKVVFREASLNTETLPLCVGSAAICLFVNDTVNAEMAEKLVQMGVHLIVLRCAGTNNVDLAACKKAGLQVKNVPNYGPNSVAEHALGLILCLNRKFHLVHERVRLGDLSLCPSLVGFEMKGKTVGIVGTGRIGKALIHPLLAMGCKVLCYDKIVDETLATTENVSYVPLETLLQSSRVVSLHLPLLPETHHMINVAALEMMQPGAILINTSRGGLVDTSALIEALKSKHLGGAGLDVYEAEAGIFYSDWSHDVLQDDHLARLTTFNNVLITCHQGYFTEEAMQVIAQTTFQNVRSYFTTS